MGGAPGCCACNALCRASGRRSSQRLVRFPRYADGLAHRHCRRNLVRTLRHHADELLQSGAGASCLVSHRGEGPGMSVNTTVMPYAGLGTTLRGYLSPTKPKIILLLLVTTVPGMVLAQRGWPSNWLIFATLVGGAMSAAGANAINCWYDRDIDSIMKRTRSRPLVTGEISPGHGLTFGLLLGAGAFVLLWAATTLAAAVLSLAALLFYVFIYTIWLKRRTPQNIVIGGAAGAFPPMVGWAGVTGRVSLAPAIHVAITFLWTPPPFWA